MSDNEQQLERWMKRGGYLPEFMRDFHDQKDVFKALFEFINANETANKIGWVDAQIFTVDVFLWFMALRGYTLQRSRKDLPFRDIQADVKEAGAHRRSRLTALFEDQMIAARRPNQPLKD